MDRLILLAPLLALFALPPLAPVARAAPAAGPGQVEELIRRGNELRNSGQDTRALPFFQRAYEQSPTPRTAAQLGLVEMALGYQLDAERHLAEALASPHDLWIAKYRAALEGSIAKVRLAIGEAVIQGPAGAEALVNGKPAGRLPLASPLRLGEGPNTVELRAPGFVPNRRTITVLGGKREQVTFELRPEEPLAPPSPPANDRGPPGDPAAGPGPADAPETGPPRLLRPAAWAAAAGAVAFVGFGIFETARWSSTKSDFESHVGPRRDNPLEKGLNCGVDDPQRGGSGCSDLYDKMQSARTLAIVGYAVGVGLGVGSAILFSVSSPAPSSAAAGQHTLACAPWAPGIGATCRLSF